MNKIIFNLNKGEQKLLLLFKRKESLSTHNNFEGYGDKPSFEVLRELHLIHHCNASSHGEYIRYALTELGEMAAQQYSGQQIIYREVFGVLQINRHNNRLRCVGALTDTQEKAEKEKQKHESEHEYSYTCRITPIPVN